MENSSSDKPQEKMSFSDYVLKASNFMAEILSSDSGGCEKIIQDNKKMLISCFGIYLIDQKDVDSDQKYLLHLEDGFSLLQNFYEKRINSFNSKELKIIFNLQNSVKDAIASVLELDTIKLKYSRDIIELREKVVNWRTTVDDLFQEHFDKIHTFYEISNNALAETKTSVEYMQAVTNGIKEHFEYVDEVHYKFFNDNEKIEMKNKLNHYLDSAYTNKQVTPKEHKYSFTLPISDLNQNFDDPEIKSAAVIVFKDNNEIIGQLFLGSKNKERYDEVYVDLLNIFSLFITNGIIRKQKYERVISRKELLKLLDIIMTPEARKYYDLIKIDDIDNTIFLHLEEKSENLAPIIEGYDFSDCSPLPNDETFFIDSKGGKKCNVSIKGKLWQLTNSTLTSYRSLKPNGQGGLDFCIKGDYEQYVANPYAEGVN